MRVTPAGLRTSTRVVTSNVRHPSPAAADWAKAREDSVGRATPADAAAVIRRKSRRSMGPPGERSRGVGESSKTEATQRLRCFGAAGCSRRVKFRMPDNASPLHLAFGFSFPDLYRQEGLARIDQAFLDALRGADRALAERLVAARAD